MDPAVHWGSGQGRTRGAPRTAYAGHSAKRAHARLLGVSSMGPSATKCGQGCSSGTWSGRPSHALVEQLSIRFDCILPD